MPGDFFADVETAEKEIKEAKERLAKSKNEDITL